MKTNKTFAHGIFAVLIALALALATVACDNGNNPTHTHDYGTAWKSNATQHWRECTADGAKTDVANHSGYTPCTVCGYYFRPAEYAIGDTGPGGGIIFYVNYWGGFVMRDTGETYHYLEAAPVDLGDLAWASSGYESTYIADTSQTIGYGRWNTARILAADANAPAAKACNDYSHNGKSDWFLPSSEELSLLYQNRALVGNLGANVYWYSAGAGVYDFANGEGHGASKGSPYTVRPVRAFRDNGSGDTHIHSFGAARKYNENSHFFECVECGYKIPPFESHDDDPCDICGYSIGGYMHQHSYGAAWMSNAAQHWRKCEECPYETAFANHRGDPCTVCGHLKYAIGDTGPGGGTIFYVSAEGFTVEMVDPAQNYTAHYLEAAPDNLGARSWSAGNYATYPDIGGTSWDIGAGRKNTALILAVEPNAPAAKACNDYRGGGYSDWFLPSMIELIQLKNNRESVSNLEIDLYWSSTEDTDGKGQYNNYISAYFLYTGPIDGGAHMKDNAYQVHPVRAFGPDAHTHSYDRVWKYNATQHWLWCYCGYKIVSNHDGNPCTVCDYATGDFIPAYAIGDTGPGGGIIFHVSKEGFIMTDTGETCHYLEASPEDLGKLAWASPGYESTTIAGLEEDKIGPGRKNTALILAVDANAPAAKACNDYSHNGKSDWFLPSVRELFELKFNRESVGIEIEIDNNGNDSYWSSTTATLYPWAHNEYDVLIVSFWPNSSLGPIPRNSTSKVRAIRAF